MMGNIFNKYHLHDFIGLSQKSLAEEIDKLEFTNSTNVLDIVERLKSKFTIEPLFLKEAIPSEPTETYQEKQNLFGSGTYKQKVFKINVSIPFEGNHKLFQCTPSSSTIIYLPESVRINTTNISASVILEDLDPSKYSSQVEKIISDISLNIPSVNAEIAPWNNGLENLIQQQLEHRKGFFSTKLDFMEKIGLKVNPKSNDYMMPPQVIKKPIPTPVTETTKNIKKEIIPILQEEVYKDIKEVLYNVGKAIERKPSIFIDKHEPDIRDIFLLFLETRYESTSGVGEAFNRKGKTDILLKYAKDGTNLFVAECKFWKGKKKLHDGIDQLLGYLTHRDSKTALIIFVDQKEFTSTVNTVKEELKKHPHFKRHIEDNYEHSISYEFILPEDSQKIIQVEVMLFHFPPNTK